jgi:hypothetical protein
MAKPPANPVSEEAAGKFAAYVSTWREVLSLGDWRIAVSEKRSSRKVMAEVVKFDLEQRSATIRLGKDFGAVPVTDENLKETALHEVLHVFLYELVMTAIEEGEDTNKVGSAEHRVINVLERLLGDKS